MTSAGNTSTYLAACVRESLSLHLYENARWLGERLVALAATEANITLLATCYYQASQVNRAYHILKATGLASHAARYLHALCCLKLGKLNEAREVLTKFGELEVPHGAAGLYLLGRVYRLVGRTADAKAQFVRALRVNPLLWSAFEELCALGGENEAQEIASYAASCRTALLQKQRQRQQQQQQMTTTAPVQGGGATAAHTVPPSTSGKDPNSSVSVAFTPGPPAPASGRRGSGAMQQQLQQQQQQQPTLQVPPSSTFTAAFTPSMPSAQCTPAAPAQLSHHFGTAGAVGGGGLWEAHAGPPPLPLRAQRSSSHSAAAAAAAAAAAETPSTHRPAATTDKTTSGAMGMGAGMLGALPQQQQPAAGFSADSMLSDASRCTMNRQLLHLQQQHRQRGSTHADVQEFGRGDADGEGGRDCRQHFPAGPLLHQQQQQQQQSDAGIEQSAHWSQVLHAGHPQLPPSQPQPSPSSFATPIVTTTSSHPTLTTHHPVTTAAAALFATPGTEQTPQGPPFALRRGGHNFALSRGMGDLRRNGGGEEGMAEGMEEEGMEEEGPASCAGAPEGGGGEAFVTPGVSGTTLVPPAPPQKNMEAMGQLGFNGHADSAIRVSERAQQASLYHGHHQARHQSHILDEGGKVRKISGKSLFHEGAAGAQDNSLSSGSNSSSSRRRSSRLAAQQQAMQNLSTGGGGSGGGNAHAGMPLDPPLLGTGLPLCGPPTNSANTLQQPQPYLPLHQQPSQQQQLQQGGVRVLDGSGLGRQSQDQPDPAHPPPLPSRTQTMFDAKLAYQPGCMPRTSFAQPVAGRDALVAEEEMGGVRDAEGQILSMALLEPAFQGYLHLAMYRCTEALQCFRCLQPHQARTAWVWCQVARAYFERMDYSQAAHAFETARQLDKQHLEGMEVYSTVLWHLKRDTDLSYLAQDLVAVDRLAPQTWCVLGNFFSLQREHEAALKLFERSLQLDPTFTYAYTLSGHEHAANDDLDSALTCYRNALRLDGRHYNAMYGMGQLYFRQEKYDVALVHFKSAALVNPQSSVLRCYWGMALAKQGILGNALAKLQEAVDLDPRNPLARYEKAGVLAASGTDMGLARAVEELEALMAIAPGEASVYFQMGKLYKRLGNLGAAQRQLETALSLNSASSADAGLIKVAIEKLSVNDEEEEEEL